MRKFNGKSNISGEIIKKYRLEKHMNREDLAHELQLLGLNIDRSHLLRLEKNEVIIKDFELLAFCEILDISYEELRDIFINNKL